MQTVERIWAWLSSKTFLAVIIGVLGLLSFLSLLIPQSPALPNEGAAFYRWLAEVRPALNGYDELLLRSGALWLRTSLWLRVTLVALALAIAARVDLLRTRWGKPDRAHLLVSCVGGLLFIAGWAMQISWGWQTVETLHWPGESLLATERELALPATSGAFSLWTGRYGLYVLPHGTGIGLKISAVDEDGRLLELYTSSQDAARTELHLALTSQSPDAYYALPEMGLVFRAILDPASTPPQTLMQIYRIASGELVGETALKSSGVIFTEQARLQIEVQPLLRPRVVYNPGAPGQGVGLLLLWISLGLEFFATAASLPQAKAPESVSPAKDLQPIP